MSEVHVSESNNTSAQKKKQRGAGARKSVNAGGAALGMSITCTNRQNNGARQTSWPTQQAAVADEEAEEGVIQQQSTSGPALSAPPPDSSESVSVCLTDIISGILKQTEVAMEELLPMISEIDSSAVDIKEQINQKRDLAMDRRAGLEQTRERFQQAASSVLEMLGLTAPMLVESGDTGT